MKSKFIKKIPWHQKNFIFKARFSLKRKAFLGVWCPIYSRWIYNKIFKISINLYFLQLWARFGKICSNFKNSGFFLNLTGSILLILLEFFVWILGIIHDLNVFFDFWRYSAIFRSLTISRFLVSACLENSSIFDLIKYDKNLGSCKWRKWRSRNAFKLWKFGSEALSPTSKRAAAAFFR